jgi:prevent-host-death family protein
MGTEPTRSVTVPLRALNQPSKIAEQVEAGQTLIVTRNGRPVMGIIPIEHLDQPVHPFRTDPMGELDWPDLDGPDLTNEEIEQTLRGMGGGLDD